MDANELRQFSPEELKNRIHQMQGDMFKARFKAQSSEIKDTSIFKKMKRDLARANTVLAEKLQGIAREMKPVEDQKPEVVKKTRKTKKTKEAKGNE